MNKAHSNLAAGDMLGHWLYWLQHTQSYPLPFMPRYRLLAIDVDGTLVNSSDELTPATQAALRNATAAGIHVVLATGRRYSHTLHLVEPLGISVPLVTASGRRSKTRPPPNASQNRVRSRGCFANSWRWLDNAGCDALLNGDTFAEGFDFYQPPKPEAEPLSSGVPGAEPRLRPGLAGFLTAPPPRVFAGFTMGTREEMLTVETRLQAVLPGKLYDACAPQPALPRFYVRDGAGRGDEMVGHLPPGGRVGYRG